jgi:RNA polymerase sigma-70 factor (ECF subfamily)
MSVGGSGNGAGSNGNGAAGHNNAFATAARAHDELESLETVERVRQAIATLPENYREVVVFCELEEMSYEEAASALDCPVGTVRSRLHRARALLLEKLREPELVRGSAEGD